MLLVKVLLSERVTICSPRVVYYDKLLFGQNFRVEYLYLYLYLERAVRQWSDQWIMDEGWAYSAILTINFHLALNRNCRERWRIGGHFALVGALARQASLFEVNMSCVAPGQLYKRVIYNGNMLMAWFSRGCSWFNCWGGERKSNVCRPSSKAGCDKWSKFKLSLCFASQAKKKVACLKIATLSHQDIDGSQHLKSWKQSSCRDR